MFDGFPSVPQGSRGVGDLHRVGRAGVVGIVRDECTGIIILPPGVDIRPVGRTHIRDGNSPFSLNSPKIIGM